MSRTGLTTQDVRLFFKRLFCRHEYEFVRNIYGDEINHVGGYRSWWRCKKCGRMALGECLHKVVTDG